MTTHVLIRSKPLAIAGSLAVALTLGACLEDTNPASDVTGNYTVTYDNTITATLYIGGAVYVATVDPSGGVMYFATAEAGMLEVDLNQFCALEEVQCPGETFWTEVSIDQPFGAAANPNSHILNVIDNGDPMPPPGVEAGVVGGLIDAEDDFVLALGAGIAGNGTNCALLELSWASGSFTKDLAGNVDGIENGTIGVGFLGGCVWPGLALGASLVFETGYTATRTGELSPPPFTPVDPDEVEPGLPDEGMEAM
jgi:hypothetical protein